jgi:hypothetical protein
MIVAVSFHAMLTIGNGHCSGTFILLVSASER